MANSCYRLFNARVLLLCTACIISYRPRICIWSFYSRPRRQIIAALIPERTGAASGRDPLSHPHPPSFFPSPFSMALMVIITLIINFRTGIIPIFFRFLFLLPNPIVLPKFSPTPFFPLLLGLPPPPLPLPIVWRLVDMIRTRCICGYAIMICAVGGWFEPWPKDMQPPHSTPQHALHHRYAYEKNAYSIVYLFGGIPHYTPPTSSSSSSPINRM